MWAESDDGIAPNDTFLEQIPYSRIRQYLESSETGFNFALISEPLQNLLALILHRQRLPERIHVRGHTTLIAALIYGLTHMLPRALLPNLTFTTYESQPPEDEPITIVGTVSGAELQDMAKIHIEPGQALGPISPDLHRYASTAVNALVTNDIRKLFSLINELDRRTQVTVPDLIELFKRRYRLTPLTLSQMEDTFLHPADNLQDLLDPSFPTEAAQLLLDHPEYWEPRGKQVFETVVSWLAPRAQTRLNQQTREALIQCIRGIAEHIFIAIRNILMAGNIPLHETALMTLLAHPSTNPDFYDRMLTEFAQGQIYTQIISDQPKGFQRWLLSCAKLMQPRPTREQMLPWLRISSWEGLEKVMKLDLPAEWEFAAIFELLKLNRDIPKPAIRIVKANEKKFSALLQDLLQQGSQFGGDPYINIALRLFAAIIHHDKQATENHEPDYTYRDRVNMLIPLLNATPNNPQVIESLISIVPFASPYQLTMDEFDRVVSGCSVEVLAAAGTSPSFMRYMQEYILALTPRKLNQKTLNLLFQFQRSSTALPKDIADLVQSWLDIYTFLEKRSFDDKALQDIRPALTKLVPLLNARNLDIWKEFVVELVPHLTTLIESEYQLQIVLNVFEDVRVVASWDLLNTLAAGAGTVHAEKLHLLFPYVIVGIREHGHSDKPKEELDAYLQSLLSRINNTELSEIDKAFSARVWPELIKNEWRGWRGRMRSNWSSNIPTTHKTTEFQQQRPVTGPQPFQLPAAQQQRPPTGPQLTRPLPAQPQQPVPETPVLPKEAGDTITRSTLSWRDILFPPKKQEKTTGTVIFIARVRNKGDQLEYQFTDRQYQQSHSLFVQVLPYWQQVLLERLQALHHRQASDHTVSLAFEAQFIHDMLEDLQHLPLTTISEKFARYLIEDILLQQEIEHLRENDDQSARLVLHPEKIITARLREFQEFMGKSDYQDLCNSHTEQAIKDVLTTLIRRTQFMLFIDEKNNGNWERWLKRAWMRNVRIKYLKDKQ